MAALWKDLDAKIKQLGGAWTAYTLIGSFALYLLGYLSLRFHLTFLGPGTDLAVLDERYFYTGAQFVVYLVTAVPVVLLLIMALAACVYMAYRVLPAVARERVWDVVRPRGQQIATWCSSPVRLSLVGIVFSVVMIQFVMRQPLLFSNLLVAKELPDPGWLRALLLSENEGLRSLYFAGLVTATAITAGIAVFVSSKDVKGGLDRFLRSLLTFLAAVQFLILPVNFAFLLTAKEFPKVANLGGKEALKVGQDAWLIWEGKDGVTYLLMETDKGKRRRSLVTFPRKDIEKTQITGYGPVLRVLFAHPA